MKPLKDELAKLIENACGIEFVNLRAAGGLVTIEMGFKNGETYTSSEHTQEILSLKEMERLLINSLAKHFKSNSILSDTDGNKG